MAPTARLFVTFFWLVQAVQASEAPMDKIKPLKNFVLSRESMRAALDAFRAGQSVADMTREVAQVISPKSVGRTIPLAPVSSHTPKPSSEDPSSRASKSSGRSRPSSSPRSPKVSKSKRALAPASEGAPREKIEVVPTEEGALQGEGEVIPTKEGDLQSEGEVALASEAAPIIGAEVAPVSKGASKEGAKSKSIPAASPRKKTSDDSDIAIKGATGKRASSSEAPAVPPAPKKARASKQPASALPPLEKAKTSVEPLFSAPNNEVLNAEDISHQSLASPVVELLRERMFGDITEALDPRLLALTGLLASSN
ncbi:nucleolar and coiled-body phosphoprotein 1-like [Manihot esculenta]|uniref:nucleolar and coiled-body phosphoprotein 1-like n=1 Tax=Manihot esculenta TaxID=3983 RepID=UPI000B5D8252|nr:nucleolar and coiled-body phosphoprotein 1-like [Manihot esculenta]